MDFVKAAELEASHTQAWNKEEQAAKAGDVVKRALGARETWEREARDILPLAAKQDT